MSAEPIIKVHSCTLSDLFGSNGEPGKFGALAIPEYQRPYMWGEKQLRRLLDDVEIHYQQKEVFQKKATSNSNNSFPMYYLGSLILHEQDNKLNIIDGQQRITTMLLIASMLEEEIPDIIYTSPVSIRNIRRNWKWLKDNNLLEHFKLDEINVTLVITQNEDDAYTFFETQNTGGVRLSGADIIKSHHLRALTGKLIRYNALKWENRNIDDIEYLVEHLTKVRYWDYLNYKPFPFYRDIIAIKNTVVDEFTEKTKKGIPVSYIHTEAVHDEYATAVKQPGGYKAIRQPLYNGSHYVEFITEYVDLYRLLFKSHDDHRLDPRFYDFRDNLITGTNGTIFLKELFEMAALAYVSKFGLKHLFEFTLWAFRFIYSLRVITVRTVREDSMTKFAKDNHILDKILSSFSHEEVIQVLSGYTYKVNTDNISEGQNTVKKSYVLMLISYFNHITEEDLYNSKKLQEIYDRDLVKAIRDKLEEGDQKDVRDV